jgi:SPP1 family predicted phage head-tail adaptor
MNPGDLRQRLTIQRKVPTQSSSGEEDPNWSTLATVWGSAEPLRGQEYLEANRLQADLDIRFRIRYRDGISPNMRVKHGDRYYNIVSVIHVKEQRREIQLMCKELIEDNES